MTSKDSAPTTDLKSGDAAAATDHPVPGLVIVFSGKPACIALALSHGRIELGREMLASAGADDDAVSRAHALVGYDGRRWTVRDQKSRNGSFVDGAQVSERVCESVPVVRIGRTILLGCEDVRGFAIDARDGATMGPSLRRAHDEIAGAARFGSSVHVIGESGAGKELAARSFHAAGAHASGPFVAVNCAAIPEGIAERLLFGAVRGAYTGADANVDGYVQSAHGGTLFLDEVAELDLAIQAKLLRVLETREVIALGAAKPRIVDFGLCSASHRDLRAASTDGSFREDLYFRIGRPAVRIPPLRERREEIPWLVAQTIERIAPELGIEAPLVEGCMQRHWPGNVRELAAEVSAAARRALAASKSAVSIAQLASDAGVPLEQAQDALAQQPPDRGRIEAALRAQRGNVTAAARALGMHRNQLRRFLTSEGIDPRSLSGDDDADR